MSKPANTLTAVSLFSGAGGFDLGCQQAGFTVLAAVERDEAAARTLAVNFPETEVLARDVRNFMGRFSSAHKRKYGLDTVDLVFGGPPCQGHSKMGKREADDPRNTLWQHFARVIDELKPRAFLMENVPGLLTTGDGQLIKDILARFHSIGYANAHIITVDAADFGVPQSRKRIFILGTRDDLVLSGSLESLVSKGLTKAHRPRVSCLQAIGDLPMETFPDDHKLISYPDSSASHYAREMRRNSLGVTNHTTKRIGGKRLGLLKALSPGKDGTSLDDSWFTDGAALFTRRKWKRFHPHRPGHAILANASVDLASWVHPTLDRYITVREAARLQGFPDSFLFPVSQSDALRQIGNAVPVGLASAVAGVLYSILRRPDRRGAQPKGDRAMTAAERTRAYRLRHRMGWLELPRETVARLREMAAGRGISVAELVSLMMDREAEKTVGPGGKHRSSDAEGNLDLAA